MNVHFQTVRGGADDHGTGGARRVGLRFLPSMKLGHSALAGLSGTHKKC
jgi:hypothetical protein